MSKVLSKYIPENSVDLVLDILKQHPIAIKIVNDRKTKHGDFRKMSDGKVQITMNNSLNQYQFLLTLIHEIAHFTTHKQFKSVKPHGLEWKVNFQHLMLPFLQPSIFPTALLPHLANYLKNPKASTGSDVNLTYALKQYDEDLDKNFVFELEQGSFFIFNNKTYKKGAIRRTRIECLEMSSKRTYLFNQNAEVKPINQ
ncbi:sprT domain-containing protein [Lutibacter sp. HS1-25]|uniref:SprT-like domain-containing protein n=1 Tax=Lutibacter sp. HS1-25 TaxID=2485000 RepID=UPI0010104655|nr:SprT-like domain-containing protein [Lutibacter sp. HS1-25]RXP63325.1 sprT domain-containing protein [Lutibacter sp. HS1-25]